MVTLLLLLLCLILLNNNSIGQDMDEEDLINGNQEQQVTLNRETVDALLYTLSSTCRVELEEMIESQGAGDMSMECKMEIQNTLQMGREDMEQQQEQQQQEQQQSNRNKRKQSSTPSEGGIHPLIHIFGFLIFAIGGIAFSIYNISNKQQQSVELKRKLSRKKLEKQRIKEQRR